jgi:hypothetical protein
VIAFYIAIKYHCFFDEVKENEVDRACSVHGGERFKWKHLTERNHSNYNIVMNLREIDEVVWT